MAYKILMVISAMLALTLSFMAGYKTGERKTLKYVIDLLNKQQEETREMEMHEQRLRDRKKGCLQ